MKKKLIFSRGRFIFTLILLCLIASRLFYLTEVPAGFNQDEALSGYDGYAILKSGKDHHGDFLPITQRGFNDWTGHSFAYQLIPFIYIFGLNEFSLRFYIAICSTATGILIYFLSKIITKSSRVSLFSFFVFTFSSYAMQTGRWATQPNTVSLFIVLGLIFFIKGFDSKRYGLPFFSLSALIMGISLYSYPSVEGYLPLFIIGVLFFVFVSKKRHYNDKVKRQLIFFTVIFFIISAPLFIDHLLRPYTIITKLDMTAVTSQNNNPLFSIVLNFLSYLLPFHLFFIGDSNPARAAPGFGYELSFYAPFYAAGLFYILIKNKYDFLPALKREPVRFILRSGFLLFPIIPSFFDPPGNYQKATFFIPFLVFFIALGLTIFTNTILKKYTAKSFIAVVSLTAIIFSLFYFRFISYYFGPGYKALMEYNFQSGLKEVVLYVNNKLPLYRGAVIDDSINQAYMYFLFYSRTDPSLLNYSEFDNIDLGTNWLKVKKMGRLNFLKILDSDLTDAKFLERIFSNQYYAFNVYEKGGYLIVKYQIQK